MENTQVLEVDQVSHLDDVAEVLPFDVVVGLDEDLSQDGLPDGVVFGVELVEAVESVAVLKRKSHSDAEPLVFSKRTDIPADTLTHRVH